MRELPIGPGIISAMRGIITFRFLDDKEARDLAELAAQLEFAEGEVIVKEGELSPQFFGIVEGPVAVSVEEKAGHPVFVSALGPGDVFGEAGIFMSVRRTATVTAQDRVVVLRFNRRDMMGFIRSHPEAGNKIMMVIVFDLLRKLKMMNQELAYERKSDLGQAEIDAMMENLLAESDPKA